MYFILCNILGSCAGDLVSVGNQLSLYSSDILIFDLRKGKEVILNIIFYLVLNYS